MVSLVPILSCFGKQNRRYELANDHILPFAEKALLSIMTVGIVLQVTIPSELPKTSC